MKALRIIKRSIRDSIKSVFRNFSLSVASIACITITLIVVAISMILSMNVNKFTELIERDVTIVAFLDLDVTQEQIQAIEQEILRVDNVDQDSVIFKDKMAISEDMMSSSEVFKSMMSDWTREESPIQDTFQVKVIDIENIGKTADKLKEIEGIEIVKYGEGMVEQLVKVFDVIRKGCIYIVIALILVTAFLITNTIKITIFSRKREIEIMRLVGASNINIKIPFILEGLLLGILGSIVPVLLTIIGYRAIYDHFNGVLFSQLIKLVKPEPFIYLISLVLLGIGMIVGMVGSARAVKKYLKI